MVRKDCPLLYGKLGGSRITAASHPVAVSPQSGALAAAGRRKDDDSHPTAYTSRRRLHSTLFQRRLSHDVVPVQVGI